VRSDREAPARTTGGAASLGGVGSPWPWAALAWVPPVDRVGSPVVCLPIGKTSKGDLVYSLDCRDIPIAADVNNEPQPVAPTVPPKPPENK
jgi:hypothetical protein